MQCLQGRTQIGNAYIKGRGLASLSPLSRTILPVTACHGTSSSSQQRLSASPSYLGQRLAPIATTHALGYSR